MQAQKTIIATLRALSNQYFFKWLFIMWLSFPVFFPFIFSGGPQQKSETFGTFCG